MAEQAAKPVECPLKVYSFVQICERAHRDLTGTKLALSKAPEKDAFDQHCKECTACEQCYRNALRAYERIIKPKEQGAPTTTKEEEYPAREVTPPVCVEGNRYTQELEPIEGGRKLEKVSVQLEWGPTGEEGVWFLGLKLIPVGDYTKSEDPNLKELTKHPIRVFCYIKGEKDPVEAITRLVQDFEGNLASMIWPRLTLDPRKVEGVGFVILHQEQE